MQRWEYLRTIVKDTTFTDVTLYFLDGTNRRATLAYLGREGWELCGTHLESGTLSYLATYYIFKRKRN